MVQYLTARPTDFLCRAGHWVTATPTDLSMIRDTLGICTYLDLRNGQDLSRVSRATALLKDLWLVALLYTSATGL